ncbi:MAG: ABC transporter ATP-binding protein [Alphaproteobacteria bacterium]|nr:ABC transporter ATP-binding protein [Alphaproteobacteria bacterium]
MTELLEVRNLSRTFLLADRGAEVRALDNVSLSIGEGEFVSILGPSGCGKSTLLEIIAGLSPADAGSILYRGVPISGPDRHRMMMFQDAALFPWLNVLDNVLFGLRFVSKLSAEEKQRRAEEFLTIVGLPDCAGRFIHELSGGMRQRVALARSLAPDPDILLMDEPFSALDAMTRELLYDDMQRIWQRTGKTIVMVTHNVREAVCLGSRVMLMEKHGWITLNEKITLPYPRSMNDASLATMAGSILPHMQRAKGVL